MDVWLGKVLVVRKSDRLTAPRAKVWYTQRLVERDMRAELESLDIQGKLREELNAIMARCAAESVVQSGAAHGAVVRRNGASGGGV